VLLADLRGRAGQSGRSNNKRRSAGKQQEKENTGTNIRIVAEQKRQEILRCF
jgi:hypothetical protein